MTTIATDGKSMAADGLATNGSCVVNTAAPKLHRTDDGTIIGFCGTMALGPRFIEWWKAGHEGKFPDAEEDFSALVLQPNGTVLYCGSCGYPGERQAPSAVGSGSDFAMAAMAMGATPRVAVETACQFDVWSGGAIHSEAL